MPLTAHRSSSLQKHVDWCAAACVNEKSPDVLKEGETWEDFGKVQGFEVKLDGSCTCYASCDSSKTEAGHYAFRPIFHTYKPIEGQSPVQLNRLNSDSETANNSITGNSTSNAGMNATYMADTGI